MSAFTSLPACQQATGPIINHTTRTTEWIFLLNTKATTAKVARACPHCRRYHCQSTDSLRSIPANDCRSIRCAALTVSQTSLTVASHDHNEEAYDPGAHESTKTTKVTKVTKITEAASSERDAYPHFLAHRLCHSFDDGVLADTVSNLIWPLRGRTSVEHKYVHPPTIRHAHAHFLTGLY